MYAWRHLVRDQPAAADEELDGKNAAISEMIQRASQIPSRLALKRWRTVSRACQSHDALRVHVAVQRIDRHFAARAACTDDRHFVVERHELFVEQRRFAERVPRSRYILRRAQNAL